MTSNKKLTLLGLAKKILLHLPQINKVITITAFVYSASLILKNVYRNVESLKTLLKYTLPTLQGFFFFFSFSFLVTF